MKFKIIDAGSSTETLEPLTCRRKLLEIPVANMPLEEALAKKLSHLEKINPQFTLSINGALWPSAALLLAFENARGEIIFTAGDGSELAWISANGEKPSNAETEEIDSESLHIKYPWDILAVNEEIIDSADPAEFITADSENVKIKGRLKAGKSSVFLPGVYIEGNVIIGENCKIGPNCYIRGNTSIGNGCHVGQAVEIKNSILMDKVSAGHLSYIGDSIICANTNLGAGTITANLRHDGKNQRSMLNGKLTDTGRRKLGAIIGDNVHTGIHTSIYPGRKIWPDMSTRPGSAVEKDIS